MLLLSRASYFSRRLVPMMIQIAHIMSLETEATLSYVLMPTYCIVQTMPGFHSPHVFINNLTHTQAIK